MLLVLFMIVLQPLAATAETVQISSKTSVHFTIPAGWELAEQPPAELLELLAEHIAHDASNKGHSPSQEQLLAAAKKRLKANEVLLYNPKTLAAMTIDFSHLRQDERPPSKESIKLSAKYAGQSLEQEEGVSQFESKIQDVKVIGAWYASRFDADYLHHDDNTHFTGIVGFSAPNWFFFYFTDYLKDPIDKINAEKVFDSLWIQYQ